MHRSADTPAARLAIPPLPRRRRPALEPGQRPRAVEPPREPGPEPVRTTRSPDAETDGIVVSELPAVGRTTAPQPKTYGEGLLIRVQRADDGGWPAGGPLRPAPERICASAVTLLDRRIRPPTNDRGVAVQIWLSRRILVEVAASMGLGDIDPLEALKPVDGRVLVDPTIHDLAASAAATLDRPDRGAAVFRLQIGRAIGAHLIGLHADPGLAAEPARGGLAPWQLRRAQDRLRAGLGDTPSLQAIAVACGLSVSHFARAFRQSLGVSPHVWLVRQRIARAKTLMRGPGPSLAEIALACGFADQSHFTRVFAREAGVSPGRWRRMVEPEEPGVDPRKISA
jgi:AraC-like DNA-binding protein